MDDKTEALLREYAANVQLYVQVNEVRQSRINWTFLIQGALFAAVVGSDHLAIRLTACALGMVISAAAYLVIGRHTAYARMRCYQAEDIESRLRETFKDHPFTFQREGKIFGPKERKGLWKVIAKHFPLPTATQQYCFPAAGTILRLRWYERFSANQLEQLVVGVVFFVAWTVLLALVAAGCLTTGSADPAIF